jgi:hypothetical protein
VPEVLKKPNLTVIVNDAAAATPNGVHHGPAPDEQQWPPSTLAPRSSWIKSISLFRLILALAWESLTVAYLGFMYLLFTCQGLIELFPEMFGTRVSKGVRSLARYEPWHRMTIGHVVAAGLMVAVLVSWFWLLREWTLVGGNKIDPTKRKVRPTRLLFTAAACTLLAADCVLFFHALRRANTWTGTDNTFAAVILTGLYLGMLVVFSLVSVGLWSNVRSSES